MITCQSKVSCIFVTFCLLTSWDQLNSNQFDHSCYLLHVHACSLILHVHTCSLILHVRTCSLILHVRTCSLSSKEDLMEHLRECVYHLKSYHENAQEIAKYLKQFSSILEQLVSLQEHQPMETDDPMTPLPVAETTSERKMRFHEVFNSSFVYILCRYMYIQTMHAHAETAAICTYRPCMHMQRLLLYVHTHHACTCRDCCYTYIHTMHAHAETAGIHTYTPCMHMQRLRQIKRKKEPTSFELLRATILESILVSFKETLVCPSSLTLHEVMYFNNVSSMKKVCTVIRILE